MMAVVRKDNVVETVGNKLNSVEIHVVSSSFLSYMV
jgi:hypothetical protein